MTIALILTIIIECITLLIMGEKDKSFYLYWAAVTALTNILINSYLTLLFRGNDVEYWITVAVLEMLVFISEYLFGLAYTKDKRKSLRYSAMCNLTSFLSGLLITLLFVK